MTRLPTVEVRQRNWENAGVDVLIDSLGRYETWSERMGQREQMSTGVLTTERQEMLLLDLRVSGFCDQPQKRDFVAATDTDWREYRVSVRGAGDIRVMRFVSTDPEVPRGMMMLVERILEVGR